MRLRSRGARPKPFDWLNGLLLGLALVVSTACGREDVGTSNLKLLEEIALGTFTKTQYPVQYEEAIRIAESWKSLGLEVRLDPVNFPNPVVERLFQTRDFDAFVVYFTPQLERLEPDFFTHNTFHSSNAVPGGWNMAGFASPEFDRLAEQQRATYDLAQRRALILQCQELLYQQNPWTPIVNQDELQAYNKTNFRNPVIPKAGGFKDVMAFFTIEPAGERKVIRWAVEWSDLKTINPLLVSESTQVRLLYFLYDTLVRYGPNTEPQFWAAEAIDNIDDTTFDVDIRKDLRFHDGTALTAEDVAFTFEFMKRHKAVYFRTVLDPIGSVEVLDRYRVRFHLEHPFAPFIGQTLGMTPLLPKHVWAKVEDPTEYRNVPPIGSGPFRFEHWKAGQEIELSRFAEHFQPPRVEGVLLVFYGMREAAFTALVRNETDVVDLLLPHQLEELDQHEEIQTVRMPGHALDALIFNVRKPPFSDTAFRLALAHAIPRQQILEELYAGYGNPGASMIAPANEAWSHPDLGPYPYDLSKAREILERAGYRWDESGRLAYGPEQ